MTKRTLFLGFVIVTLILMIKTKPIDPSKIVVALNCGAKTQQVNAADGHFKYLPDQQFVKGSSIDIDYHNDANANEAEIKYTLDKEIFMYERHTYQQMTYELPVKKGKHTIILKFAEMYFKTKGQRVFDIKIGQTVVLPNFDVIQKSGGKYAAHEEYIQIDVRSNGVYFNDMRINQGLENNKLKLSFVKGRVDNPIVQAIIVYHDTLENSPKKQFTLLKTKWNTQQQMLKAKKEQKQLKELIQIQKKKERIVIRNDQLVIEEENNVQNNQVTNSNSKFGTVRKLLMSELGVIMWAIVFGYVFFFISKNLFNIDLPFGKVSNKE